MPVSDTLVALAAAALPLASRLAAVSDHHQRRAGGQREAVQRGQRGGLGRGDRVGVPLSVTLVALASPAALPLASRLAAVSATTSVAPEASAEAVQRLPVSSPARR